MKFACVFIVGLMAACAGLIQWNIAGGPVVFSGDDDGSAAPGFLWHTDQIVYSPVATAPPQVFYKAGSRNAAGGAESVEQIHPGKSCLEAGRLQIFLNGINTTMSFGGHRVCNFSDIPPPGFPFF